MLIVNIVRSHKYLFFSFLMMCSLLVFSSCDSTEEGCLDIQATNFDVSVDNACMDCCTYPKITLRINHIQDTLGAFKLNTVYLDAQDQPFTIESIQFYISELQLVRANGNAVGLADELALTFANNTKSTVEDNFTLFEKTIGSYTHNEIGSIRTSGDFTKIRFYLGVTNVANHAEPSAMPSGHDLAIQSDTMHWNVTDGYIFNKIKVQKDTSSTNLTTLEIGTDANLILVELDYPITINTGFDISLAIDFDYKKLFDNIQFQADTDETIKSKIISNTADAFSVSD